MYMRVVLINTPWAKARLPNIAKWWGLQFRFDDIVELNMPYVPMQQLPDKRWLAVLDMAFVNKYKKGFTLFVAPYSNPKDGNGDLIPVVASVRGVFLPPALAFQRWEWFMSRLFWDQPVIQVFANETENSWANGIALGPVFELYANHEFSHWLKQVTGQEDTTHKWFYEGTPEVARAEIMKAFIP